MQTAAPRATSDAPKGAGDPEQLSEGQRSADDGGKTEARKEGEEDDDDSFPEGVVMDNLDERIQVISAICLREHYDIPAICLTSPLSVVSYLSMQLLSDLRYLPTLQL
eukprot:1345657-Rhodomonas_salina.1